MPRVSVRRKVVGVVGSWKWRQRVAVSSVVDRRVPFSSSSLVSTSARPTMGISCQGMGS